MGNKETRSREFRLRVLGRTLELLGMQMYKRRNSAIAELVANAWDAGATILNIHVSGDGTGSNPRIITIADNGVGMDPDQLQEDYLQVGRNRRKDGVVEVNGRRIMGRKGIGKLAGFGIAQIMGLKTWRGGVSTEISLDIELLKQEADSVTDVPIQGTVGPVDEEWPSGTRLTLRNLKHQAPLDIANLHRSLARRFSRHVKGEMAISINDEPLSPNNFEFEYRYPEDGSLFEEKIDGDKVIKYYYGLTKSPIHATELRGFTVYIHGKTAQAPPFYFNVEGTASGQHGTRYLTGEIEVEFLDTGTDDSSDIISTDRQQIEWEDSSAKSLEAWGQELTRKILRDWSSRNKTQLNVWLSEDSELQRRIDKLDEASKKRFSSFLSTLSKLKLPRDEAIRLGDSLITAFEFRQFHDIIDDLDKHSDDPAMLGVLLEHLSVWKVLESRALLEIISGRLSIIDKFDKMIISDTRETPHHAGDDNLHDLIAGFPWLLNPEWQAYVEEKSIGKILKEWTDEEITDVNERERVDFLALTGDGDQVVIEIKRSGYPVSLEELQRLERYKENLSRAKKRVHMVMICGSQPNVSADYLESWEKKNDGEIRYWSQLTEKTKSLYEHWRTILERHVDDPAFQARGAEVAQTRKILDSGSSYRSTEDRKRGLGPS